MESVTALPVKDIIHLLNAFTIVVGILAIGFTLVGLVSVWRAEKQDATAFFRMFERLQVLQMTTVMLVIASATILAMLGLLSPHGITGILSGVAGYVLGGLGRDRAEPGIAKNKPSESKPVIAENKEPAP